MKEKEMIQILRGMQNEKCGCAIEEAIKVIKEVQKYRGIGTVEEFMEAFEKQKAKKPILSRRYIPVDPDNFIDEWYCPSCGTPVGSFLSGIEMEEPDQENYCCICGQHIARNWGDTYEQYNSNHSDI